MPHARRFRNRRSRHRPIAIVRTRMARECAGIRGVVIRNGESSIRSYNIQVKIDQAFARNARRQRPHTMPGVANRT